jgi:hypothetical protein
MIIALGDVPVSQAQVFSVDDEVSSGATPKTMEYVLVKKIGLAWNRIYVAVVHWKNAKVESCNLYQSF